MQIGTISSDSLGTYPVPGSTLAREAIPVSGGTHSISEPTQDSTAPTVSTLQEPVSQLASSATGSGEIPVKMAAAAYVLQISFDIQAQALDLLA